MIEIAAGMFARGRRLLPGLSLAVYTGGLKAAEGGDVATGGGPQKNSAADETWRSGGRRDWIGFSWSQRFDGFPMRRVGVGFIWPDGTETVRRSFFSSLSLFFYCPG